MPQQRASTPDVPPPAGLPTRDELYRLLVENVTDYAILMLTPEGQVKVLDFGLAHFVSENRPSGPLTEVGTVMGTPDYIAPEQAMGAHDVDHLREGNGGGLCRAPVVGSAELDLDEEVVVPPGPQRRSDADTRARCADRVRSDSLMHADAVEADGRAHE